jgi:long-chain acyl-CoA synthetase
MLNEEFGVLLNDGEAATTIAISTLPRLLLHSRDQYRKPDAFKFKQAREWIDVSADEFVSRIQEMFFALRGLGVKSGDRVAIISENRVEWAVADFAALCAGAVTVPVYPTLSAAQIEVLLADCTPVVLFVSTTELFEKVLSARASRRTPHVIVFESPINGRGVMKLDLLYEMGRRTASGYPGDFRRAALSVAPEDLATIIYTSGTTGVPKGAMLTHRNLVSNVMATHERLPLRSDDISLSFLPLSHVFQRHVDYAALFAGATTAYAQNIASVAEDMKQVRPTVAAGVPRFFERIHARIHGEVSRGNLLKRAVFDKAIRAGREYVRTGRRTLAYDAADRLVFRKIREQLGGRMRLFISGGAALSQEIAEFFWAIGLPVYEGYGLSETSPVVTLNGPSDWRLGSVGRPVGDQQIRIAEDGEILVRGSNVMKGYYGMERETVEALAGGWFHTGDIGELDADKFLKITDRKKDLIVTSGGKNVAPQPIETRLRQSPYFENVVVIGDRRSFLAALIVPNYEALAWWARGQKIPFQSSRELIHMPEIHAMAMAEIQSRTSDLAPFERIRKLAFLDDDFRIAAGELTPTLKVRRSVVEKKYESLIDRLYAA